MKVFIKWQAQFGYWKHYTMTHKLQNDYRSAKTREKQTAERER